MPWGSDLGTTPATQLCDCCLGHLLPLEDKNDQTKLLFDCRGSMVSHDVGEPSPALDVVRLVNQLDGKALPGEAMGAVVHANNNRRRPVYACAAITQHTGLKVALGERMIGLLSQSPPGNEDDDARCRVFAQGLLGNHDVDGSLA